MTSMAQKNLVTGFPIYERWTPDTILDLIEDWSREAQNLADSHGGMWIVAEDEPRRVFYILPYAEAVRYPDLVIRETFSPTMVEYDSKREAAFPWAMAVMIGLGLWALIGLILWATRAGFIR